MMRRIAWTLIISLSVALSAAAQDYKIAKTDAPAPAQAIASAIASQLATAGIKVTKGSAVLMEMWPAKEWPIAEGAAAGGEVLYPLTPGQVIGVARYSAKAADFRDQEIPTGTYVVRYGQ